MNDTLKKRIEEASAAYADKIYPISYPQHSVGWASFREGARFALSHQWISVDEALPELMERVLVAYRLMNKISVCIMKRIPHDSADPNNDKWHWSLVNHKEDVIAWTPIPKFTN